MSVSYTHLKAGEAQARTQAAVLTAQENAQREIEEAKARKVEQALNCLLYTSRCV